jgi:hypothetical protein
MANICRFYNLNANWVIDKNEKTCLEPRNYSTQTVHKPLKKKQNFNNKPRKHWDCILKTLDLVYF